MVLLDTNVFIIDRFFPRDERYKDNKPVGLYTELAIDWFERFSNEIFKLYRKKMTWGDAVLLLGAEEHGAETIVTWNTKHFINRTMINVLTPNEYL